MLRGDIEGDDLEKYVEERVLLTRMENAAELGARERAVPAGVRARLLRDRDDHVIGSPRYDLSRFGAEVFRSPRARPTC